MYLLVSFQQKDAQNSGNKSTQKITNDLINIDIYGKKNENSEKLQPAFMVIVKTLIFLVAGYEFPNRRNY